MGAYQYIAIKKSGHTKKGIVEADSLHHARQLLRDQGLIPTEIHPLNKTKALRFRNKLKAAALSLFTRQLATLLGAGIPVEEALRSVAEQTEKESVRAIIIGVRTKVTEGFGLAVAMSQYPQAFPELYCATVSAGEHTGRLDLVLNKLALYTENQQTTKQKIQQALIYPTLMIAVSTTIISFLLAFVVPKIIEVFKSSGQSLPIMTQVLLSMSDFIKAYGLYFVLVLIGLYIGFRYSLRTIKIKIYWHGLILKLPIVAYLSRALNVARYIHTFGILFAAGVSVLETMRVSASVLSNEVLKDAFTKASLRVKEGAAISDALKATTYLSPMAVHLIASGEKSGQLPAMMDHAASHIDSEIKRLIDTALTLLEPLIILFMGAMVLFIVLATLLPIFSMEQLVS